MISGRIETTDRGGLNLYGYGPSDPLNLHDPRGLAPRCSRCPHYPPGCGTPPNPACECDRKRVQARIIRVHEILGDLRSVRAPATVGCPQAQILCGNEYLGEGWYIPSCRLEDWQPSQRWCSGDECVDFCTCRHERFHFQDRRKWNINWDPLVQQAYAEIPACEEELRCLWSLL